MSRTITLKASALRALVTPVLPLACDDDCLPPLNAVLIESLGAYLTAMATDRYRIGLHRIQLDERPPAGFSLLVRLADLRKILTLFKATRREDPEVELSIGGDGTFTVQTSGSLFGTVAVRMAWLVVTAKYPADDLRKILRTALAAEPNLTAPAAFNPHYLADFKAASLNREPVRLWGSDPTKAFGVAIGDDFIGAIMPVRSASPDGKSHMPDVDSWAPLIAEPTPAPAKKATRKRAPAKKTAARKAPAKKAATKRAPRRSAA